MSIYNGSIITISLLIFLLGAVAVKSARSGGARAFILISACFAYTALFVGPLQLLSYAKPTSMEWVNRNVEEAEVLHAELREGEGIYLLLDWYGTPRYYKIPWDVELAQQLIEAMEQARGEAGGGQRAGSAPPSERTPGDFEQEQGMLDGLLGPQGDDEGDGTETMAAPQNMGIQGQGQPGQSEMQNAGNGKVMMRRPFSEGEMFSADGGEATAEEMDGEGPSAAYNDTPTAAMFYAKPQPRYPEKEIPSDGGNGFMRSFDDPSEEEDH